MEHIRHHTLLSVTTSYIGRPYVIINTRDVDDFRDPASDREGERASRRLYMHTSLPTLQDSNFSHSGRSSLVVSLVSQYTVLAGCAGTVTEDGRINDNQKKKSVSVPWFLLPSIRKWDPSI